MNQPAHQSKARAHRSAPTRQDVKQADVPERRRTNPALALQASAGNAAVSELLSGGSASGRPLPPSLRCEMEQRFSHDFRAVRLYNDTPAAKAAAGISAKAFTIGNHVVFGAGRFAPDTYAGKRLIAHELAHVIQQSRGGSQPSLDPSSHLERGAQAAGDAAVSGTGPISVPGAAGLGVARDDDEEKKKSEEEDNVANMTTIVQTHKQQQQRGTDLPVHEINDPKKGVGVLGEVTVPFAEYSGWDWNHIGGGEETKTSRTSLARQTRYSREPSAGFDFVVENAKTGRLVIGEQKSLKSGSFTNATATSRSLEKNLAHTIDVLNKQIADGKVHPDSVKGLEQTIGRLQATLQAVKNKTPLPEGVVFEFTNLGGKSKQIGKDYIDHLAKKYGDNPEFLDHLLSRTFVRDPQLAKAKGRDPGGKRGTDADPDIVPAKDILTPDAADRLAQIKSGMTPRQWAKQKKQQKEAAQAAEKAEREARKEQRKAAQKAKRDEKAANKKRAAGEKAAKKKRDAEEKAAKKKQAADEKAAERKRAAEAKKAQKPARKKSSAQKPATTAAKQDEAAAKPKQAAPAEKPAPKGRKAPGPAKADDPAKTKAKAPSAAPTGASESGAAKKPPAKKAKSPAAKKAPAPKKKGGDAKPTANKAPAGSTKVTPTAPDPQAAQSKTTQKTGDAKPAGGEKQPAAAKKPDSAKKQPPPDTPDSIKGLNTAAKRDAALSKGAKAANQGAAAIRASDAYDEAKKAGKGEAEAVAAAAKTYLDNTNIVFGAFANAEAKQKKGQDPVESWISTLGETGAGFIVPGKGWDQAVNAVANLVGAAEDHANRNDPNARTDQASLGTLTDFAAQLTPSRMFSQTIGGGARSYYNIGKFLGGDGSGIDRFGEDAAKGELGMIFQPWGMAADFVGNLGSGEGAEKALNETMDKAKGSTIEKIGSKSGDLFYDLGQSDEAKSGEYGAPVQGWAMISSIGSDLIAGKTWDQALNHAAEPGKGGILETVGSAGGDLAWAATEKTTEFINEDIPKAKQTIVETYTETKEAVVEKAEAVKETVSETAGEIKSEIAENYEGAKQKYQNTRKYLSSLWD